MDNIQQFFAPIRKMSQQPRMLSGLPYDEIYPLVEMCELFSKINNVSTYIIDYVREKFLYVSSHPLFLSGYTAEEAKEMSYSFYEKVVSPQDLEMLLTINKMGWGHFYRLPVEKRQALRIFYSFYLHHRIGGRVLVLHKLAPVRLLPDGNPWLAVCFVSNSPYREPGNVVAAIDKEKEYYMYDYDSQKVTDCIPDALTGREIEILNLTMRGYEEPQIAKELCISPYTVKNHRKKIIQKLGANNLSNAVAIFNSMF